MDVKTLDRADVDMMTALDLKCFPPGVAFSRGLFADCMGNPDCDGQGIVRDGELVAFSVVYYPGRTSAQIVTIDVHPDYRRQGLADTLMERIEKSAKERGAVRAVLQVSVENAPAKELYEKWGYRVKSVLTDYYGPGNDAFLMDKKL